MERLENRVVFRLGLIRFPDVAEILTGKIVEWNDVRGFGFLEVRNRRGRVFLHRRDFARKGVFPAVGDWVEFQMGMDPKGRPCAMGASFLEKLKLKEEERPAAEVGRVKVWEVVYLSVLMVAPALACLKAGLPLQWVGLGVFVMSVVSYFAYRADKRRAQEGLWRISEGALHLTALLGGWPGAYVAQRIFRHKISKGTFLFLFWVVVAWYQFVAVDSMNGWKVSKAVARWIGEKGAEGRR